MTKIQWTERTWNPTLGCSKKSLGCGNCYAIKEAHRMAGNPNPKISSLYSGLTEKRGDRIEWTGLVKFVPERLEIPLRTRKLTVWFVDSMSDLFHENVSDDAIRQIWEAMHEAHKRHGHIFQILTKRPERMCQVLGPNGIGWYAKEGNVPCPEPGIWLGVSVENQKTADERIPLLLNTPSVVRWLSIEPMLEEIDVLKWLRPVVRMVNDSFGYLNGNALVGTDPNAQVNWVVCGGESGPNARPFNLAWARSLRDQCKAANVPFFFKQAGSVPYMDEEEWRSLNPTPLLNYRNRDRVPNGTVPLLFTGKGGDIEEIPVDLQIREFPAAKV